MTDSRPAAVVTADPTIMDGLVVRWRATTEGPTLLSASRDRVMVHGDVTLSRIEPWLADARRAHEALKAGRRDEAEALATHRFGRLLSDDLIPIERAGALMAEITETAAVPAGELAAFGLMAERLEGLLAGARTALEATREQVASEIEEEAAGHLHSIRRGMRWAAWVARGKPPESDPGKDYELSGALLHGKAWRTSAACCPVETAAVTQAVEAERERIRDAVIRFKTVLVQPENGYPVDAIPFAALLGLLGPGVPLDGPQPGAGGTPGAGEGDG